MHSEPVCSNCLHTSAVGVTVRRITISSRRSAWMRSMSDAVSGALSTRCSSALTSASIASTTGL